MTRISAASPVIAAGLAAMIVAVAGCGSSDGPQSFLAQDASSAVSVQWKRVGNDLSGSISTTEVTKPETGLFAEPAGEIKQQSAAFTGTVEGDSVRLQLGGGALGARVNGRLDGDNLELGIPQDEDVKTVQLKPGSKSDYAEAVQQVRNNVHQDKDEKQASRMREQRTARTEITRVATAYQQALDPKSPDDPCRYMTSQLRQKLLEFWGGTNCKSVVRDPENVNAADDYHLASGPQGVAEIKFDYDEGPLAARVVWRPASGPGSLSREKTGFTELDGRWLISRCCM